MAVKLYIPLLEYFQESSGYISLSLQDDIY